MTPKKTLSERAKELRALLTTPPLPSEPSPDYDHAFRLDPDNDAAKARADAIRAERAKQESGLGDSVPQRCGFLTATER